MRLICPNCGAQYEIAEDMIPPEGRDVQCSDCGHIWFERPGASVAAELGAELPAEDPPEASDPSESFPPIPAPAPAPAAAPESFVTPKRRRATPPQPEPAPEPAPASEPRRAHPLAPDVKDILREEAAFSSPSRAPGTVESQPDLGLATPAPRRVDHRAPGAGRDLLPDIEEINSSLRNDTKQPSAQGSAPKSRSGGFRAGFLMVLLLAALALGAYVYAPALAPHLPAPAAQMLQNYVDWVDGLRLMLDLKLQEIMAPSEALE